MYSKVLLICMFASAIAVPASLPRDASPVLFNLYKHGTAPARPGEALAKAAAMDWKKISSVKYTNTDYSGTGVTWGLSMRDTVVYDALGHMVVTKTSIAGSGWSLDSLYSIDSCVYVNNWLAEQIQEDFDTYGTPGTVRYGTRDTYSEKNNGSAMVSVHYDWNMAKKIWEPSTRDSLVLSGPFSGPDLVDISILVKEVAWSFDTVKGEWKITTDIARVDSECTPVTYVMEGVTSFTGDSLFETRMVMTFISPQKTFDNLSEEAILQKDPASGVFREVLKALMTYDKNGYKTGQEVLFWDSLTQSEVSFDKSVMIPDAYGNDTLTFYCYYSTVQGAWDTSSLTRYTRQYDAYGNNVSTVTSTFDALYLTWDPQRKDTVVFARILSALRNPSVPVVSSRLSVKKTPASVRFSMPGICGLRLYDMSGRLVLSMDQKPASGIDLADHDALIRSGTYIARIVTEKKEMSVRVSVLR
jgi:hypothetical protein